MLPSWNGGSVRTEVASLLQGDSTGCEIDINRVVEYASRYSVSDTDPDQGKYEGTLVQSWPHS